MSESISLECLRVDKDIVFWSPDLMRGERGRVRLAYHLEFLLKHFSVNFRVLWLMSCYWTIYSFSKHLRGSRDVPCSMLTRQPRRR